MWLMIDQTTFLKFQEFGKEANFCQDRATLKMLMRVEILIFSYRCQEFVL